MPEHGILDQLKEAVEKAVHSPLADAITEKAHQVLEKIDAALPHPTSSHPTTTATPAVPVAVKESPAHRAPSQHKSASTPKAAVPAPAGPRVFKVKRGQKHR